MKKNHLNSSVLGCTLYCTTPMCTLHQYSVQVPPPIHHTQSSWVTNYARATHHTSSLPPPGQSGRSFKLTTRGESRDHSDQ